MFEHAFNFPRVIVCEGVLTILYISRDFRLTFLLVLNSSRNSTVAILSIMCCGSLVPRLSRGRRKRAWYTLFAHALNIPAVQYFRNPLGYSPYISCSPRHRTSKLQTMHAISADQAMTLPAFRDVSLVDLTVLAVLCQ